MLLPSPQYLLYTVLFAPLAGALISLLAPSDAFASASSKLALRSSARFKDRALRWLSCSLIELAACCAVILLIETMNYNAGAIKINLFTWLTLGEVQFQWQIYCDALTVVMLTVVTVVSAMVHIYSLGYMAEDPDINRFIGLLSLFSFFMLLLVSAGNVLQLFCGWEGVGLASYLLIGFWYQRPSANNAAIKAFVVNRVGDVGLVIGLCLIYVQCNTLDISEIASYYYKTTVIKDEWLGLSLPQWTACMLFIGAMGKSAQLGLHVWLPDAMEGPTPVSALIHAATMVTAGVFMLARLSPIFEHAGVIKDMIAMIGALTAVFAGFAALAQHDIKRVIAYSTCSQLGYMVCACGVSLYNLAIFHLFTHAFFKALLFLGAGAVIHGCNNIQDMRQLGGVYRKLPITYLLMLIGAAALMGVPLLAGFYSKDAILLSLVATGKTLPAICFILGLIAALFTVLYNLRMIYLTFHGRSRSDTVVFDHIHEAPANMQIPMVILSSGALSMGYLFAPIMTSANFWRDALAVVAPEPEVEGILHLAPLLPLIVGTVVMSVIWLLRSSTLLQHLRAKFTWLYQLSLNACYFDELYQRLVVVPYHHLSTICAHKSDQQTIDRLLPGGASSLAKNLFGYSRTIQTGRVYDYLMVMVSALILLVIFAIWVMIRRY